MELRTLKLFIDVAKLGSFAEVARQQDCDPSQVSRAIAALERHLQVRLFKRSTRKLSLTEAGTRYLARIKPLLEELGYAQEEARQLNQTPSGQIRITASTAFGQVCLLPLLPAFYTTYPDIELELRLTDSNVDLFNDDIDLACRLAPSFQSDLIGIKLLDTQYRVCASPAYLDKQGPIERPEDLLHHQSVVLTLPQYRSSWQFKNTKRQVTEITIPSRLAVSNALALRECLLQGLGPGLAANWLIDKPIQTGALIDIFPDLQVTATDFQTGAWLLYPSRQYMPAKTRVMIDFLKKNIAETRNM